MSATLRMLAAAAIVVAFAGARSWGAAAPGASATLPEVTIASRRAELQPKVSKFVSQIAARDAQGLPRWMQKVCPQVTGLPKQEGEFMLERLTEIAGAAGVGLAGEQCRPNLFIFVTAKPEALLGAMQERKALAVGDATASDVSEFIATQRPVRVWYNCMVSSGAPGQGANVAEPNTANMGTAPTYNSFDQPTHLLVTSVRTFASVFVIIDQTRLHAVSRGQLADYVGMVALAELKPSVHVEEGQSILKLFDGAAQAAPAGMSEWDQAFLKSLYASEPRSKQQREQIASTMVREIVH